MLPTEREGKSPFIAGTTLQFAWDSTSLGILKECPQKYKYSVIDGWRTREESVHLLFGGWFASALERYHKLRAQDATHLFAQEEVVEFLLTETFGWESGDSKKNRETLLRSVIWYLENYKDDAAKTVILSNGAPAAELSFQFEIDKTSPDGTRYLLCGHLDRLVDFDGTIFVQDQKTTGGTLTAYYFMQFNPHNQMSLYTLASRVVFNAPVSGVMIDAAQIAVGFTAFGRSITMRSEDQLEEWLHDTMDWIGLAEHYARSGNYPKNESSCHKFSGCQFRDVCSKSPAVRENFLRAEFDNANPWNPLRSR